jgi:hypothetical protein
MAPSAGLEPTTNRLTAGRSTTELTRHLKNYFLLINDNLFFCDKFFLFSLYGVKKSHFYRYQ